MRKIILIGIFFCLITSLSGQENYITKDEAIKIVHNKIVKKDTNINPAGADMLSEPFIQ